MAIINPYQLLKENLDEINLFWDLVIKNNGDQTYLNRLKVAVQDARKRRDTLTVQEREIVAEIFGNEYNKGFSTGSYLDELNDFLISVERMKDKGDDEMPQEYVIRRFSQETVRRRYLESRENLEDMRGDLGNKLGGLFRRLFESDE